ncbi:hypothetical protein BH18ACT10_BH18ACT10_00060 [soil metagenome]
MSGLSEEPPGPEVTGRGGGGDDAEERREYIRRLLRNEADDDYIGKPGGQGRRARHIRKIPLDEYEPESFFADLVEGGREREGTSYPGVLMELPGLGPWNCVLRHRISRTRWMLILGA